MNHTRVIFQAATRELDKVDKDMPEYSGQALKDMRAYRSVVASIVRTTKSHKIVDSRVRRRFSALVRTDTIKRRMWGLK